MTPFDFITQYWTILGTITGGVGAFFVLQRDVKQLEKYVSKHEKKDDDAHQETARRVDRIEEVNMLNSQSNAVLTANIQNLKEQFVDIKDELRAIRNLLEGLFREKK